MASDVLKVRQKVPPSQPLSTGNVTHGQILSYFSVLTSHGGT